MFICNVEYYEMYWWHSKNYNIRTYIGYFKDVYPNSDSNIQANFWWIYRKLTWFDDQESDLKNYPPNGHAAALICWWQFKNQNRWITDVEKRYCGGFSGSILYF